MSQPNEKQAAIGAMSHEQLLTLIEAMRKPVKSEKELREEAQAAADRKQMGEMLEQGRKNKLAEQAACPHIRFDGSTTCVHIDQPVFKLYCQMCGSWIEPEHSEYNKLYSLANR